MKIIIQLLIILCLLYLNKYFIIDILDIYIQKIDINDLSIFLVGSNKKKKSIIFIFLIIIIIIIITIIIIN
jgi:hypothetical protein